MDRSSRACQAAANYSYIELGNLLSGRLGLIVSGCVQYDFDPFGQLTRGARTSIPGDAAQAPACLIPV
jgi:hypothetical protein